MTNLETPAGCRAELSEINAELGEFSHIWSDNAGRLKHGLKKLERIHRAAMLGIKHSKEKLTIPDKDALAYAAVEETAPGLLEEIEELEGKVEEFRTRFKVLERRASNAQSILGSQRDEAKMGDLDSRLQWSGNRG